MKMTIEQYDALYPKNLQDALIECIKKFTIEQKPLRELSLKEYKKYDYYWNSLQNYFWSDTARDWRPYEEGIASNPDLNIDQDDIGRVINVYRAYGESIVAALSAAIPEVAFAPDDADNPDDISTAKAYSQISDLINRHNDAQVKLIQALFILFNQSFVACYNYYDESTEYGTKKVPIMQPTMQIQNELSCPQCGGPLDNLQMDSSGLDFCPICNEYVSPIITPQEVEVLIPSYEDCPKSREIIELYGPLNVKIPFYASQQKNCPYLILEAEYHVSDAKDMFPWVADKIKSTKAWDSYEKWARQPSEVYVSSESDIVTIRRSWIRPSAYWMLTDDLRLLCTEKFPNGAYIAMVDDVFAEAYDENIDDHWTITKSPISQYLHAPPLGRPLADIQDMTNDMFNVTYRTIKYGIPMTFADSNVIDWDNFRKSPSEPGQVYPAYNRNPSAGGISGSFHTVQTASLSREVDLFTGQLEQAGQFVSGAFPSIYGGTLQGGGKTFKEYDASRSQALQRLGITWKMLNGWWKDWTYKACKEFARNMQTDEKYAVKNGNSYINVWIKKAELSGSIGDVEAETSDQFPVSMVQQRGLLLDLLQMGNPEINAILGDSQNIGNMSKLLTFNKLFVPGDDQRNKQLAENTQLSVSAPVPSIDQNPQSPTYGQPIEISSIPIEPIDNDQIHSETLGAFLVGEVGQYIKTSNPDAYRNLMLHLQEHQQRMQQVQQQQMQQQQMMILQQKQMEEAMKYPPNKVNYNVSEVNSGQKGKVQ
jgi:hypothetical protein